MTVIVGGVADVLCGMIVAWYVILSIAQGMREIMLASMDNGRCKECSDRKRSYDPEYHERLVPAVTIRAYRSTMIYRIVSYSPIYRLIVWLWRPRA